jgi:hypothetical protein
MSVNRAAIAAIFVAAAGLGGCSHATKALGVNRATPDEFRVVAKAPLVIPPDYSLRPPAPGEAPPQELQPESAARVALLGERQAEQRSQGEQLLVAKAGGDKADPLASYVIDDQFGDIAHKDPSFADKVMFWRKDKPSTPQAAQIADAAASSAPIDPAVEQAAITKLTGDKPVIIQRGGGKFVKLPGL